MPAEAMHAYNIVSSQGNNPLFKAHYPNAHIEVDCTGVYYPIIVFRAIKIYYHIRLYLHEI